MTVFRTALLGCVVLMTPAAVCAQTSGPVPAPPTATTPSSSAIDASALGISLSRISRRLAADAQARSAGTSPLSLVFHIDVFGSAPELRLFANQDLFYGAVPGSAPTHRDMLAHVTPQPFRSPRADVLGAISRVSRYGARKAELWNYDRHYEAYRKRVEAGQAATAPKPPQ